MRSIVIFCILSCVVSNDLVCLIVGVVLCYRGMQYLIIKVAYVTLLSIEQCLLVDGLWSFEAIVFRLILRGHRRLLLNLRWYDILLFIFGGFISVVSD